MPGHTVTVTAPVSVDQTYVEPGGQITVNSGVTLTVVNNSAPGLAVYGTVQNNGTLVINSGSQVLVAPGAILVNSGVVTPTGTLQVQRRRRLPAQLHRHSGHHSCRGMGCRLDLRNHRLHEQRHPSERPEPELFYLYLELPKPDRQHQPGRRPVHHPRHLHRHQHRLGGHYPGRELHAHEHRHSHQRRHPQLRRLCDQRQWRVHQLFRLAGRRHPRHRLGGWPLRVRRVRQHPDHHPRFLPGANYVYNGAAAQNTGSRPAPGPFTS